MIKKENHMVRVGQTVGRRRDAAESVVPPARRQEAGQAPYDPWTVTTVPWRARDVGDDRRAILASERSAVFDRPSADILQAREPEARAISADSVLAGLLPDVVPSRGADDARDQTAGETSARLGPIPVEWTPDLVHCRLVAVYWLCAELPRIQWPAQYRSVLEQLQPASLAAPGRRRVLSAEDMDRIDWTLTCVCRCPEDDQLILRGFMAGLSLRDIAGELQRLRAHGIGLGKGVGKNAVARRYRVILSALADQWIAAREPIDADTHRVWRTKAEINI